jgi:hypothetical protein
LTSEPNTASESSVLNENIVQEYREFIEAAGIQEAMAIEDFINPIEEEEIIQSNELEYLDTQLTEKAAEMVADVDEEESEEESVPLYSNLSQEEEVRALAMAIAIYERRGNAMNAEVIVEALRSVQRNIRWELAREKEERVKQRTISQYFKQ